MKLQPFEIEQYFRKYEFSAPHQISASDCEPYHLNELLAFANPEQRAAFDELWLGYTETPGMHQLRQAISELHEGITAEQVLEVVPQEGIYVAMSSLLEAGDHIIAVFPCFQSLYEVARAKGCELAFWAAEKQADGWRFDVDALEKLIRPHTKMLVVNFPHNPTGCLPSVDEFSQIVALARRHGLILFSDEIYRFIEQDGEQRLPSAAEIYEKAVVLGGLSKAFGLPGLRVGWLIAQDAALMSEMLEMKSYTTICGSAPSEILALIALDNHAALTRRSVEIVRRNIAHAKAFFARYPDLFAATYPQAGTVALAELKAEWDVYEFAEAAVREQGVMVLPANIMKFTGNYFRLGFGRRSLPHALEPFEQFVQEHLR